ncbi:L,D-transpeptidase [Janibacter corallicola]|uniref:L,D-transpeptidase n=1 Tax=Janibacter corallicola TaxID=415212 RepID=UPI002481116C|nr:Ig-like domain-containing protein [Janibacter corallicola]
MALTACSGTGLPGGDGKDPGQDGGATSATSRAPAKLAISPGDSTTGVRARQQVRVRAKTGTLRSVTVTDEDGNRLEGARKQQTWASDGRLAPDERYEVHVVATGPEGRRTERTSTFSTFEPKQVADYHIVYDDWTVGVAMPVSIQFEEPVAESYQDDIERAVSVKSTSDAEGAWGWLDDRQLMWRPRNYWEPGTRVSVNAPLTGYQTGPDSWIEDDATGSMTIGRRQLTTVDIDDHEMQVERDGETLESFPISSGRPGKETETRSGTKVVILKDKKMTMDSSTVGIDKGEKGYYKVDTKYNVRVTWTGEFLHSAPWSVDAQGSSNVSHGCVNLSPEHAKWFYEHTIAGDPVDFTGSDREFDPGEGIGVWQYSWQEWQQQSALG